MESGLGVPWRNRMRKAQQGTATREDSTGRGIIHKRQHRETPVDKRNQFLINLYLYAKFVHFQAFSMSCLYASNKFPC